MLDYVKKSQHTEFIIGTETGIIHTLKTQNPDKIFIPADEKMICIDMKKITLTNTLNAILHVSPVVKVAEDVRVRAKKAIERMLAIPRD